MFWEAPTFIQRFKWGKKLSQVMKRGLFYWVVFLFGCFSSVCLWAEQIELKNGDVLSVKVVKKEQNRWIVDHPILGRLILSRDDIVVREKGEKIEQGSDSLIEKKRQICLGVDRRKGNTNSVSLNGSIFVNYKGIDWEKTLKAQVYYSTSNGEMDDRKAYFMIRSGYSFGRDLSWYWFGKLEEEHDRFAGVRLRSLPSFGLGYWFSDKLPLRSMLEASLGWELVDYYESENKDNLVSVISGLIEYEFDSGSLLRELITFYPSLEGGEYRLRSETSLSVPVRDGLAVRFSLLDEYCSDLEGRKKKNDIRFVSSLEWNF